MTIDPVADFIAFRSRRRQEFRRKPNPLVTRFGPDTTLWLAAVPQWTVALAKEARLPLTSDLGSVEDLVQFAYFAGVAARRKEPAPGGGDIELFWVDEATRRTWITELVPRFKDLSVQVTEIAERVDAASRVAAPVPALTRRWLDLVRSESGRSGTKLFRDIAALVSKDRLAEAAVLTDAAAALAPVRGGTYPAAVLRGRRLLQAGHRRRRDREALADFVPRDDLITPLIELIRSGPGEPWALHLLGPGGVGKTMLLRYLASNLLAKENKLPPFTVARVDFDHISPDYPVDRPVQLLTELADDVIVDADADILERQLRSFFASAESVNAAAADSPLALNDPLVTNTVGLFAKYLSMLPAPQVLVLDTCEELAKIHPVGAEVPAITRTFELLYNVWEQCPTVRVVFAGRRYLAKSGAGWELPERVTQRAVVSLAARDYLQLDYVLGFVASDAEELLRRPHPDTGAVPSEAFVHAVLDRSPEVGSEVLPPQPGRYNPFMIAHYRSWWEDEPELTPQAITEAGPDAYVAVRIVSRLQDGDLVDLLPALTLLGRFDEIMLADAMAEPPNSDRVNRVVEALAEQEWTEISIDSATGLRVLALSEGLLPMLREWAHRPEQQPMLAAARDRLAGPLQDRLEDASLSVLTAELVTAALREYAPGWSALAWAKVEERVEHEARWDWAGNILRRVRAEMETDLLEDPLLAAALAATALAAQWRYRPTADMSESWTLVRNLLEHTDGPWPPEVDTWRARLAARAELGRLRAAPASTDLVRAMIERLAGRNAAPLVSVVAGLESVLAPVPTAERIGLGLAAEAVRAAAVLTEVVGEDPAVIVGGLVALATLVPHGERAAILVAADERAAAARPERAGGKAPAWADRPLFDGRDPRMWVALHRAAVALAVGEAVHQPTLTGWMELADRGRAGDVDADRLGGCCTELWPLLGAGPGPGTAVTAYHPAARPSDAVHDETPARFVAFARSLYRAGLPMRAEAVLDDRRQLALEARAEDATIRAADEALAWLAIRMRRVDYRPTAMSALHSLPGPGSALADALRVFVDGDFDLMPGDIITELTSLAPPWLGRDITLELALALAPDPPTAVVRDRVEKLRDSDPLTACQLATALALRQRREDGVKSETVALARDLYAKIPAAAELPPWGSVGASSDPADPWSGWRARWALLDESAPARSAAPVLHSPELLPSAPSAPSVLDVAPRRGTGFGLIIAVGTSLLGAVGVGVYLAIGHAGPLAATVTGIASAALGAVAASLAAASLPRWKVGAWLRRRLTRGVVLAVTIFADPYPEVSAEQRLNYGRIGGSGFWRWPIVVDRNVPRLLRRWGPAPGVDGRRIEPPLHDDVLAGRPFRSVATVLDPKASLTEDDWEHDLIDIEGDQTWRCIWVRDGLPGVPLSWPKPSVALSVPEEWAGALTKAYEPLINSASMATSRIGLVEVAGMARIEHRMGLPVDTRSGPVLQITQGDDVRTGREQSYSSSYSSDSSAPGPPAWLIVVQVTPVDGLIYRDARTAALTRRLALDIQRETGAWVLALPALPPPIAEEIWQALGQFARRKRRARRWHLVACVGEIKRVIVESSLPGQKRLVAQDVLLIGPWWAS